MSAHDWRRRALCFGMDTELFFPVSPSEVTPEAANACRLCPVAGECLAWAQETVQVFGTWGGLSESERLDLRNPGKRNRRQKAALRAGAQDEAVA